MGEDIDARGDNRHGRQVDEQWKDVALLAGVQGEEVRSGGNALSADDLLDLVQDILLRFQGNLRFR